MNSRTKTSAQELLKDIYINIEEYKKEILYKYIFYRRRQQVYKLVFEDIFEQF